MIPPLQSVLAIVVMVKVVSAFSPNPTTKDALPGANLLAKGYNLIKGTKLSVQGGVALIDYQWNGILIEPFGDDQIVYEIPIEFQNIPKVAPSCSKQTEINSVYHSTSTSILQEQSTSFGGGYSQKVDLGISVPLEGVTVSAKTSYTNSLMFGHSSNSVKARAFQSQSYSWSFSMDTLSTLYQTGINWNDNSIDFQWKSSFTDTLTTLDNNPTNNAILSIINAYGSHVMREMTAGALCKETAYIKSSATKLQALDFHQQVNSISGSFLFWSASLETSNSERKAGEWNNETEYQFANIYCKGQVVVTSQCGGVTGTSNSPIATSYTVMPIWDIDEVAMLLSNATLTNIDTFFDNLYETMKTCSEEFCSSQGTCTLSDSIWTSTFIDNWDGTDFSKLWNTTTNEEAYCFCYVGYLGQDCSQKEPRQTWYWSLFTSVVSQYRKMEGEDHRTSENFPNWSGLIATDLMFVDNAIEGTSYNINEDISAGPDNTWWDGLMNGTKVTAQGNDGNGHGLYVADVFPDNVQPGSTFTVYVYQKVYTAEPTASPTTPVVNPADDEVTKTPTSEPAADDGKQYGYFCSTMISVLFVIYTIYKSV